MSSDSITIQGLNLSYSGGEKSTREGRARVETGRAIKVYRHDDQGWHVLAVGVSARFTAEEIVVTAADGSAVTIRPTDFPPMTFRATPFMADGGFDPNRLAGSYRLADVQVGDAVTVQARRWYQTTGSPKRWVITPLSKWECDGVQINRRPGGRVPPAHNSGFHHTWHEWVNAMQDFEERGVPLPERYWSEEERRRIAPPPHAALDKISEAAP